MQSEQMSIRLDRLTLDPANVRKNYDPGSIEEMKASILAHGIIQPIAVRPPMEGDADLGGQLYRIFAGGRRFRAMNELLAEQKIDAEFSVPIVIRQTDDATASELSLAENVIREQMSPVDEFRGFKTLADQGLSVAEIALRFGQTDRFVKGRLALGDVHPEILEAFATGKLSFEAVAAYTVERDQDRQVRFFRDADQWSARNAQTIRAKLRGTPGIRANGPVALFIGEEAYVAAGGIISEDLFGDNTAWVSGDIIEKLKADRWGQMKAEALAEGWSFAETLEEFGIEGFYRANFLQPEGPPALTHEETSRLDELTDRLENEDWEDEEEAERLNDEYERLTTKTAFFTAEQKARAGVLFDPQRCEYRLGAMRAAEAHKEGRAAHSPTAAKATKDPLALTQPLKDKIGEVASDALAAGVMANPHKALALVTAMLATADVYGTGIGRPSRIKVERIGYGSSDDKKLSIMKLLGEFDALSPEELLKRFAGFAAQTVDLTEAWFQKDYTSEELRAKTRKDFLEAFASDPLSAFDADEWFSTCTKPMIEAAAKEMGAMLAGGKKADMARAAAAKARETGWLPKPLRLKGYALKGVAPKPKAKGKKKEA